MPPLRHTNSGSGSGFKRAGRVHRILSPGVSQAVDARRFRQPGAEETAIAERLGRPRHRSRSFNMATRRGRSGVSAGRQNATETHRTAEQLEQQLRIREALRRMDFEADPTEADSPFEGTAASASRPARLRAPARARQSGGGGGSRASGRAVSAGRPAMGSRSASFSGRHELEGLSTADRRA